MRQIQPSVMTHSLRASSQEITNGHTLGVREENQVHVHLVAKNTPESQTRFCSMLGWRWPRSSLEASIHTEADFPSPQGKSQTVSTLHLAFCLFLSVSRE